jgi:hypothetical protein
MESEKFETEKIKLLLLAGDTEKADAFNTQYQSMATELAGLTHAVDPELRHSSVEQMKAIRRIAGIQVRYLAEQKKTAMADDFAELGDDEFKKA